MPRSFSLHVETQAYAVNPVTGQSRPISKSDARRIEWIQLKRNSVRRHYDTRSKRAARARQLRQEKKQNRQTVRKLCKEQPDNKPLISSLRRELWEASVELDLLKAQVPCANPRCTYHYPQQRN